VYGAFRLDAPLPKTEAERRASGDPRPLLDELYGRRERYVAVVTAAAQALVRDRLLLPEDAGRCIAAAKAETAFGTAAGVTPAATR
jgi:hypothetical protein